jgi:hypothetical protein
MASPPLRTSPYPVAGRSSRVLCLVGAGVYIAIESVSTLPKALNSIFWSSAWKRSSLTLPAMRGAAEKDVLHARVKLVVSLRVGSSLRRGDSVQSVTCMSNGSGTPRRGCTMKPKIWWEGRVEFSQRCPPRRRSISDSCKQRICLAWGSEVRSDACKGAVANNIPQEKDDLRS